MSTETEELVRICEALSRDKRLEVADFAKFLLERQGEQRGKEALAKDCPCPARPSCTKR
jgi:hypothetical protein